MKHTVLVSVLIVSCGSPGGPGPSGPCAAETRADTFTPGLERVGSKGQVKVQLLDADPSPPAKGDNRWTARVVDSAGVPVEGATILTKPFMPDHQHGTSIKAVSTPTGMNGEYVLEPVNLFMPSLWEVTLTVQAMSPVIEDAAVFSFCIEG